MSLIRHRFPTPLGEMTALLSPAGLCLLEFSEHTRSLAGFEALLRGKVSLLVGHSGVGKSTLVNAIDPSLDLHTLEISASTDKGQHTTTAAQMFELLMGNEVAPRKEFIVENASDLDRERIDA